MYDGHPKFFECTFAELTDSLEEQKHRHQKESADLTDQIDLALETWENINREFNDRYAQIM